VRNPYFFFTIRRFFEQRGGVLFRLLAHFVSRSVPWEIADFDEIKRLTEEGKTIFYITQRSSLIEQFLLNVFLLHHRLPVPSHSFGPRTLIFFSIRDLSVLFFEWLKGGGPRRYGRRITGLYLPVEDQTFFSRDPGWANFITKVPGREIWIVPVLTLWNKELSEERQKKDDWLVPFFGTYRLWPTFRELLLFLLGRRRLSLRIGIARQIQREKYSSHLYRRFYTILKEEKKNIVGASLRNWLEMRNETLFALEKTISSDRATAEQYLDAIAARYGPYFTDRVSHIIGRFLSALFSRIEYRPEETKYLRRLAAHPNITLIFIPSHRSYFDYLIMFHLLYHEQVAVPLVVAGDNLDFFPLGAILRRLGAFFIRRRVRDNPLYREVFKAYLRTVIESGYHVEFFIEGGRTRSGKIRAPRTGILSMLAEIRKQSKRRIYVVPISITYEQLPEVRFYPQEITGGKEPERKGFFRKFLKLIRARYGPAYVSFGTPMYLPTSFSEEFAGEVAYRIERNGHLSFSGMFAAFFTTHDEIYVPGLARRMEHLTTLLKRANRYRTAPALDYPEFHVPRLVERLVVAQRLIPSRHRDYAYRLSEAARSEFIYHRNTSLFAFAPLFMLLFTAPSPTREMARTYLEATIQGYRTDDRFDDLIRPDETEPWVAPMLYRLFLPSFRLLEETVSFFTKEHSTHFESRTGAVKHLADVFTRRHLIFTCDELFDVLTYLEQRGTLDSQKVAFKHEIGQTIATEVRTIIEILEHGGRHS